MSLAKAMARLLPKELSSTFRAIQTLPGRPARYGQWPARLDVRLRDALDRLQRGRPYCHQAQVIERLLSGEHVVVVTPTASGKTLCYNVPVVQSVLEDNSATALYLFPTKALAQDQLAELERMIPEIGAPICASTYDGDTPSDARKAIRAKGHIVVSNPDMLHQAILPHHTKWARFFSNLRYVVIDELHTYRGVFGSHMANLLRRLQRICGFYEAKPQFIMCSATIANPQDLAERLVGDKVALVDDSGAPSGDKTVVFYNPPVIDSELGIRRSYLKMARNVACRLLDEDVQTLVFSTSRQNVEVLTRYLKDRFEQGPQQEGRICGYRGGYLPNDRRRIEKGIRTGAIRGVVSTNALELGIDIGALEAVVLAGYPGTVASTWQQIGRAGRRSGNSLAVFIAKSSPLDQFIVEHSQYFFGASPERALINPDNLSILVSHVKCAAFELPFQAGEKFGGRDIEEILEYLSDCGLLYFSGNEYHWLQNVYPADGVSLRSAAPSNFTVHDIERNNQVLAEVDWNSAPTTIYEEAIYMVQASTYTVKKLDYERQQAYVQKEQVDYYTEAITSDSLEIIDVFEEQLLHNIVRAHGEVHVASRVSGFKKIKFDTRENVGFGEVHLPDQEMQTTAFWLSLSEAFLAELGLTRSEVLDGVVGLAYCLHNLAPFFLMCDVRDIRRSVGDRGATWSVQENCTGQGRYVLALRDPAATQADTDSRVQVNYAAAPEASEVSPDQLHLFEPTIFLYESLTSGVGFAAELYDLTRQLLTVAAERLKSCDCDGGCPSCSGPANEVGGAAKRVATIILEQILSHPEAASTPEVASHPEAASTPEVASHPEAASAP